MKTIAVVLVLGLLSFSQGQTADTATDSTFRFIEKQPQIRHHYVPRNSPKPLNPKSRINV
jgi:hypothetical protein